jgi:hypothetical protein
MSQWIATYSGSKFVERRWKVYDCDVWDMWRIFGEGMELRWVVKGNEKRKNKIWSEA